ncbi:MAG: peptidogalycan biosysnthesis protein, partial [Myxococcales bacterium]
MYEVKVHERLAEIPREDWDALVDEEAAPFLEWTFLDALEESGSVGPEAGWTPAHLTVRREGRLVAAAPAYLKPDSSAEWVDDSFFWAAALQLGLAWSPRLVLAVPHTPATGRRLLVRAGEDRAAALRALVEGAWAFAEERGATGVHVNFCTAAEATELAALGFVPRKALQYHWRHRGERDFDGFLERFTSRRRKQVRKERAALEAQGVTLRVLRGAELAATDPDGVWELYRATYDKYAETGLLTRAMFPRLVRDFSHRMELVEAWRGERRIAGAICFSSAHALYGRYWGALEPLPFLHFNVALYRPVEECLRRGLPHRRHRLPGLQGGAPQAHAASARGDPHRQGRSHHRPTAQRPGGLPSARGAPRHLAGAPRLHQRGPVAGGALGAKSVSGRTRPGAGHGSHRGAHP